MLYSKATGYVSPETIVLNAHYASFAREISNVNAQSSDSVSVNERRFIYIPTPNLFSAPQTKGKSRNRFGLISPSPPSSPSPSPSPIFKPNVPGKSVALGSILLSEYLPKTATCWDERQKANTENSPELRQTDAEEARVNKEDDLAIYPGHYPLENHDSNVNEETEVVGPAPPEAEKINEEVIDIDDAGDSYSAVSKHSSVHDSSPSVEPSMANSPSHSSSSMSPSDGIGTDDSDMSISDDEDRADDESILSSSPPTIICSHFRGTVLPSITISSPPLTLTPLERLLLIKPTNSITNIAATSMKLITDNASESGSSNDDEIRESKQADVDTSLEGSTLTASAISPEVQEAQQQHLPTIKLIGSVDELREVAGRTEIEYPLDDSVSHMSEVSKKSHETEGGQSSLFARDFDSNCADDGASDGSISNNSFVATHWQDGEVGAQNAYNLPSFNCMSMPSPKCPLLPRPVPGLDHPRPTLQSIGSNSSGVWPNYNTFEHSSQQFWPSRPKFSVTNLWHLDDARRESTWIPAHDSSSQVDTSELTLPPLRAHPLPYDLSVSGSSSSVVGRNEALDTASNLEVPVMDNELADTMLKDAAIDEDFYWTEAEWTAIDSHHSAGRIDTSGICEDVMKEDMVSGNCSDQHHEEPAATLPSPSSGAEVNVVSPNVVEETVATEVTNSTNSEVMEVVTAQVSQPIVEEVATAVIAGPLPQETFCTLTLDLCCSLF